MALRQPVRKAGKGTVCTLQATRQQGPGDCDVVFRFDKGRRERRAGADQHDRAAPHAKGQMRTDVTGDDDAIAVILTGAVADARITGGSLEQLNGGSVEVGEIDRLQFTDGMTSHGATLPAQSNRAKLVRGGVDVTGELVR